MISSAIRHPAVTNAANDRAGVAVALHEARLVFLSVRTVEHEHRRRGVEDVEQVALVPVCGRRALSRLTSLARRGFVCDVIITPHHIKPTHLIRMKKLFTPMVAGLFAMTLLTGCLNLSLGGGSKNEVQKPTTGQQLVDLQKAKDSGALTDAEFQAQKAKLLNTN
jgi:hypothetical protein